MIQPPALTSATPAVDTAVLAPVAPHVASESQRAAIEADPQPLLVLAGPGAGKTFCLIERIRFLVETLGFDPARICAFTFTNKAAGEIASRLELQLGPAAERVKRGTIHAFCAELLREFGAHVGVEPGFGIADENYQLSVLRRLEGHRRWHKKLLSRFCAHRFHGDSLLPNDAALFERYRQFLDKKNVVDFDTLVLKAAALLGIDSIAEAVRGRWDCVLVDEFQDLNKIQYAITRALAREHRNVFAVGDDEQSIYSWTGADPAVFRMFTNDFGVTTTAQLGENRRCPREVVSFARRLVAINPPIFADRKHAEADHDSPFHVAAFTFTADPAEIAWIIDDIRRDRDEHGLEWGDFALLYRKHEIGDAVESSFLTAGIPCRLAQGRALAEDPVAGYVIAALRVIANGDDPIHPDNFLQVVLPKVLFNDAYAKTAENESVLHYLEQMARRLPREHEDRRKIWRGLYTLQNLAALGARHTSLTSLVQEILSQRVGEYRTVLEDHHDDLSDPAGDDDVQRLADRLVAALETGQSIWIPRLGGVEIALKGILRGVGLNDVRLGGSAPPDATVIAPVSNSTLGMALALFKAAQLVSSRKFANHFRDFTAIDLETTDRDIALAEIVEIAAVKIRDGKAVGELHSLVKPRVPIAAGAQRTHGLGEGDLAGSPFFENVWPKFREFCDGDVLVAHNGYRFDFPILRRMTGTFTDDAALCTYDTLPLARELSPGSRKLVDLARAYGVDPGQSHRALDDTRTLAHVFLALGEAKVARWRKTSLVNLLDHLGVALALSDDQSLGTEARLLKRLTRPYALGRYSDCLDFYRVERDEADDMSLPTVGEVIERLGGEQLMLRYRADKTAEQRYPAAMLRLRPLLDQDADKPLAEQITGFLERAVLSSRNEAEPERTRVNLLTLHSTKGLEFSRVYVVGVEDSELPGRSRSQELEKPEIEEARRLLYVGMTRTKDRLVLTRVDARRGKPTGGHRFLDEMHLVPRSP
jgi:superfamily I DNA/RNA helicase/DNA polymerase III epsilon subunit-like protein